MRNVKEKQHHEFEDGLLFTLQSFKQHETTSRFTKPVYKSRKDIYSGDN